MSMRDLGTNQGCESRLSRRGALALGIGLAAALNVGDARAQAPADAENFIRSVIEELRGLIQAGDSGPDGAAKFLTILEDRAALDAVANADLVLLVCDRHRDDDATTLWQQLDSGTTAPSEMILVHNKIDLDDFAAGISAAAATTTVGVSATTGAGIDTLKETLVAALGMSEAAAGEFGAQARHLDALERARAELRAIDTASLDRAPELAAEHYRRASSALEAISGRYPTEALLGEIFARFCIGK